MTLFSELKRRNVFRVAAAYLVSAWLLIEIGSLMFDAFEFPGWASQLLIVLLALGLLPSLIFAWAYELTPEGLRRESEVDRSRSVTRHTARRLDQVTIAMILLALGVVMVQQFVLDERGSKDSGRAAAPMPSEARPATPKPAKSPASAPDPKSVAVLPFLNMSADPENEYFSDGISEELINLLVRIDGLRVPSRTSSFAFKGRNTDIRDIANSLQVAHVLEGSVRKHGERVRITAQLIDVRDDRHLWSATYDRELTDIFAIQDEIAGAIIGALQVALGTAPAHGRRTDDLQAYDLYLQGLHLFRQREQKLLEAEHLLRQAVAADPDFAEAWAALALVHTVQPYYLEHVTYEVAEPKALEAADRALALDPTLPDPRAARTLILQRSGRLDEAMAMSTDLVADHPQHALSRVWHGILLLKTGYLREALAEFEAGYRLDPVSGVAIDWLARARLINGDAEGARALAWRAVNLDRPPGYVTLIRDWVAHGDTAAFARAIETMPESIAASYASVLAAVREPERAGEIMAALGQARGDWFVRTDIHFFLSQPEPFFHALNRLSTFDHSEIHNLWWPAGGAIRRHPEMKSFAADHGLVALWRHRGWPDLCRPLGPEDFECD